jgi:hypothetical protein
MENKWINHTAEYEKKNDMPYKDTLNDPGNAATYYMEKTNDNPDCTTQYKQEMCMDMYSLNAINDSLSKMSLSYKANNKTIQQSRDFIRNKSHISKLSL